MGSLCEIICFGGRFNAKSWGLAGGLKFVVSSSCLRKETHSSLEARGLRNLKAALFRSIYFHLTQA